MAFRIDTRFKSLHIAAAYVRVSRFEGDKTEVRATVTFHTSPEESPFMERQYVAPYALESGNPISQVYAHLKTLPEFADAVDC